jgi:hypothetical protein
VYTRRSQRVATAVRLHLTDQQHTCHGCSALLAAALTTRSVFADRQGTSAFTASPGISGSRYAFQKRVGPLTQRVVGPLA